MSNHLRAVANQHPDLTGAQLVALLNLQELTFARQALCMWQWWCDVHFVEVGQNNNCFYLRLRDVCFDIVAPVSGKFYHIVPSVNAGEDVWQIGAFALVLVLAHCVCHSCSQPVAQHKLLISPQLRRKWRDRLQAKPLLSCAGRASIKCCWIVGPDWHCGMKCCQARLKAILAGQFLSHIM